MNNEKKLCTRKIGRKLKMFQRTKLLGTFSNSFSNLSSTQPLSEGRVDRRGSTEWVKSLKSKQKIGTLIQLPILNINLTNLLFIYRASA